jgi:hypothetical protein
MQLICVYTHTNNEIFSINRVQRCIYKCSCSVTLKEGNEERKNKYETKTEFSKIMRRNPYHFYTHLFHTFLQLIELHVSTNIGHYQALMYGSWVIAL